MSEIEIYEGEVVDVEVAAETVDGEYFEAFKTEAERIVLEMGTDLEDALNFIRQYQRALRMVGAPDPNGHPAQLLLQKYDMNHKKPSKTKIEVPESQKELEPGNDRSLPA